MKVLLLLGLIIVTVTSAGNPGGSINGRKNVQDSFLLTRLSKLADKEATKVKNQLKLREKGDCAQVFGGCTKHEDCCSTLYCSQFMGKCYEDKNGEREKGNCAQLHRGCVKHEDCCPELYCSQFMGKCYEDTDGKREKGNCAQVYQGCAKNEDCCSNYCSDFMRKCYNDRKKLN